MGYFQINCTSCKPWIFKILFLGFAQSLTAYMQTHINKLGQADLLSFKIMRYSGEKPTAQLSGNSHILYLLYLKDCFQALPEGLEKKTNPLLLSILVFQDSQSHSPLVSEGVLSQQCYESLQQRGVAITDDSHKYTYTSSQSGYGEFLGVCASIGVWLLVCPCVLPVCLLVSAFVPVVAHLSFSVCELMCICVCVCVCVCVNVLSKCVAWGCMQKAFGLHAKGLWAACKRPLGCMQKAFGLQRPL